MTAMATAAASARRAPVLAPPERVSEVLFGLYMALTFVGAISVAESGRAEVRELLVAAIACNLAWGLVDAVMYVVRAMADRGRILALTRSVRAAPDAATARERIVDGLPAGLAPFLAQDEVEAMRRRIAALAEVPERPTLTGDDLLAALGVFVLVVAATFPVVLPFVFIDDLAWAKGASRAIALAMLFAGGLALGRYAGYGSWRTGLVMVGLGAALVAAVIALGG